MERRKGKRTHHRRVKLQMVVLLLLFTLLATLLTGWILYDRTSEQVIRDTWQQQEALVRSACAAVNREIEQVRTFSWQLGNDNGVQRYLHLAGETPTDILAKRNIIEKLQQMKAFSNTMADIGIYAEGLDIIITGESSYRSADYYGRIDGITRQDMEEKRSIPGSVALSRYAGRGTVSRILSREAVLAFVSSLPLNTQAGKSYAFFHLNADKLAACLPESDAGTLLLADAEGNPVLAAGTPDSGEACRQYMRDRQNRIRIGGSEYGVLGLETASDGLFCMAVIPTSELLKPSLRLRDTVMLVMGSCMVIGLLGAVLASKRLYAPLERLIGNVRQMCHSLPEETRGNEYKILDDAIHTITAENHELTLSNREVNRLLKNRLLNDWMEGRLRGSAAETLAKAGVDLPYDRVQAAVAEISPRDLERLEAGSGMNTADRMEELAAAADRGPVKTWCARRTDGRILVLFNIDAKHPAPEEIYQYLQACREEIFGGTACAIGVGRAYEKDRISDSLVDAMLALRSGEGKNRDISFAEEIPDIPNTEYTLTAEQQLINRILSGRGKEASALVRMLCSPEAGSSVPRTELVRALLFTVRRAARQANMEDRMEELLQECGFQPERMPAAPDAEERLCRVVTGLAGCMNTDVSSQEEKHYARLTEYIRNGFMRDISLDSASEALEMSPSYIGLIFRKVGGTSFLKYLTDIRMEEARRLLRTTDLTLREIGVRVGIENQNTLIRTFKKAEGITPGQYRMADPAIHSQNG